MQNRRFFQDDIYRLNREISRFTDQGKKKIVLSAYNPINLCVNYFFVKKTEDVDRWKFDENQEEVVKSFLKEKVKDDFKGFLDKLPYSKLVEKYRDNDLHYFLINIYNNFPVNPNLFFDGIIKKVLSEFIKNGKLLKYAFVDALKPEGVKFNFKYFQWFDMCVYCHDKPDYDFEMGVIADQERGKYFKYGNWFGEQHRKRDQVKNLEDVIRWEVDLHQEEYFVRYLQPFFIGSENEDGTIFYGDKLFDLKVKQLSEIGHLLIIPFYDSWIDEKPCGMIQGNLSILPFENDANHKKRKEFIKDSLNKYTDWSRSMSQLLHESRIHDLFKLSSQPEDDILRDFLRKIACIQEWKKIMVFNISENHPDLRYCFTRFLCSKANNSLGYEKEWDICKKEKSRCEKKCFPPGLAGFLDYKFSNDNAVYENQRDNTYLFCIMLEDILRSRILPSVEGMDISRYKNHILCFEFPEHTFFPKAKGGNDKNEGVKRLGEHYIDKLIPIFDRLLLSRKVLKHSIKSAVAAVMGRNMSHNIGSHVLSYLSDEYLKDKSGKKIVYSLGFYRYLQGRSDYIAEISTTRPIWATQMRLINDVIDPFVYSDYRTKKGELLNNLGRSVYHENDKGRIHLDASKIEIIITLVKEETNIEVQYYYEKQAYVKKRNDKGNLINFADWLDLYIDIPHGVVGCHAFYSILENFLRNSFKHKSAKIIKEILNTGNKFKVYIEIDDNIKYYPDLIRVKLHDNVSDYSDKIANGIETYLNGEESKLVNKDGSLKTDGGWGIKEMRISSAWLRNISLEDVQSVDEVPALISIGNTAINVMEEEANKLYFEFYLQKPLIVLLVDSQRDIKEVPSAGIYKVRSKEKFIDLGQTGKLRHKFVVINDKKTEKWIRDNKKKLPPRIFLVGNKQEIISGLPSLSESKYKKVISRINNNEYDLLEKELNEWWVNYLCDKDLPTIYCVNDDLKIEHNNIRMVQNTDDDFFRGSIIFHHGAKGLGPSDALYWETYGTGGGKNILSSKLKMIRDVNNSNIKLKIFYELYEVALARIVIVDERLFTKLDHETNIPFVRKRKKVKIFKLLHRWNMDVINLGEGTGDNCTVHYRKSDGKTATKTWSEYINERKVTFLSIHQTIIDNKITEDVFKNDIAGSPNIRNVIIHSGRGQVKITPGFKFVEYSNVEKCVTDKPDKHQLCSMFMNISSW